PDVQGPLCATNDPICAGKTACLEGGRHGRGRRNTTKKRDEAAEWVCPRRPGAGNGCIALAARPARHRGGRQATVAGPLAPSAAAPAASAAVPAASAAAPATTAAAPAASAAAPATSAAAPATSAVAPAASATRGSGCDPEPLGPV